MKFASENSFGGGGGGRGHGSRTASKSESRAASATATAAVAAAAAASLCFPCLCIESEGGWETGGGERRESALITSFSQAFRSSTPALALVLALCSSGARGEFLAKERCMSISNICRHPRCRSLHSLSLSLAESRERRARGRNQLAALDGDAKGDKDDVARAMVLRRATRRSADGRVMCRHAWRRWRGRCWQRCCLI